MGRLPVKPPVTEIGAPANIRCPITSFSVPACSPATTISARPFDQLSHPSPPVRFPAPSVRAHSLDQLSHPSPHKRIRLVSTSIPDELGKLIAHDSSSLDQNHDDNLVALFRHRQDCGDFTDLARIKYHPAYRILKTYGLQGAPVKLSSKPWTTAQNDAAIARGPHKSANEYVEFLRCEMAEMVKAAQWIVLCSRPVLQ